MTARRGSLAVAALAAGAAACAGAKRAPQRHDVEIRAFAFAPAAVPAYPGDTLVFVNHDAVPHTATADNGAWDTGSIAANGTRAVVIPANGVVPYHCAIHTTMTARVDSIK